MFQKSIPSAILSLIMVFSANAQSAKYENAMRKNVAILDTAKSVETFQQLANNFERIANSEKNQWMPYYYAGLCIITQVYSPALKDKVDEYADHAEKLAMKADSLSPKNGEIMCLLSMVNSGRIMVDPQTRGMKYGIASGNYLTQAMNINANNPRIYYLQGMAALYTPEQYGGGKEKAKGLLQKALDKYASAKVDPDFAPHWGADRAQTFIKMCEQTTH